MTNEVIRVAVPATESCGMSAKSSEHFGRCPYFAVVEVTDGKPAEVLMIENPPHQDCFGPVNLLASQDVNAIIVQGIGMRPLLGFRSVGIEVYTGSGETVGDLMSEYTSGKLIQMDENGACSGGRHYGM
ncbi:NifB/NifX family molybdenum-iron cluster-binding protein [bacterium]|nr:NifB/NifX family molybdenum-iron cluster-binding protein [bacterium]